MAKYRFVLPTKASFEASFAKIDKERACPPYLQLKKAIDIVERRYASALRQTPGLDNVEYNPKASPGFTFKVNGIKTKQAALESHLLTFLHRVKATPLCQTSPKNEALPLNEILDNKIRTFFAVDMHHCVNQWFLFNNQEHAFIELCKTGKIYGKYGFVKQFGGFDRLVRKYMSPDLYYKDMDDASGWDRVMPFMIYCYYLRTINITNRDPQLIDCWMRLFTYVDKTNRMTVEWLQDNRDVYNNPKSFQEQLVNMAWQSSMSSCFPLVIDSNGLVVLRYIGNISGNPGTTMDNTMGHEILEVDYQLHIQNCKLLKQDPLTYDFSTPIHDSIVGVDPKAVVDLFGDDNVKGYPLSLIFGQNDHEFKVRQYARFGIVLKPSASKYVYSNDPFAVEGFEFLGSTFAYNKQYKKWYPMPRSEKIASSILYSQNQDIETYAQRIIGLANVAYGDKFLFSSLIDIINVLISNYPQLSQATSDILMQMLEISTTPEAQIFGFEGSK